MLSYLIRKLMVTFSAFAIGISIVGYMISAYTVPKNQTGMTIFLVVGIVSGIMFIAAITKIMLENQIHVMMNDVFGITWYFKWTTVICEYRVLFFVFFNKYLHKKLNIRIFYNIVINYFVIYDI